MYKAHINEAKLKTEKLDKVQTETESHQAELACMKEKFESLEGNLAKRGARQEGLKKDEGRLA